MNAPPCVRGDASHDRLTTDGGGCLLLMKMSGLLGFDMTGIGKVEMHLTIKKIQAAGLVLNTVERQSSFMTHGARGKAERCLLPLRVL